jgi:hypothetical protein
MGDGSSEFGDGMILRIGISGGYATLTHGACVSGETSATIQDFGLKLTSISPLLSPISHLPAPISKETSENKDTESEYLVLFRDRN